jgi:hypothetical protein
MKIRSMLVLAVVLASGFAHAQSSQSSLSQSDAQEVFSVLSQAEATTQYPAAEYSKIKDIKCNLDKIQMMKGAEIDEEGATSCSFKKESGQEVSVSGSQAMKLKEILHRNNCQGSESGAYSFVEAKEMVVNYDRLQQSVSGHIKK